MLSECKRFLRQRCPRPYRWCQRVYYRARRSLEAGPMGSALNGLLWRFKDLWDPAMPQEYIRSAVHPHRRLVLAAAAVHAPFESLLEVGSNAGPNLYLLAQAYPQARFRGLDINRRAVEAGRSWLAREGVANVELEVSGVERLGELPTRSHDLVLADALLMYLGPDVIDAAARDMVRIARKAVIVADWHDEAASASGEYYDGKWKRNYRALFAPLVPAGAVHLTKIPPEVWAGDWGAMGYVIDVRLAEAPGASATPEGGEAPRAP